MIYYFDSLPSTNKYAKENINKLANGDIICAAAQSAGRGRKDRVWISAQGGLYFTFILKPQKREHLANFTQLMALCVCKVLNRHGVKAYLKWPNDVLCEGKKLCGILSEVVFKADEFCGLALGVGININSAPDVAQRPAGCLFGFGFKTEPNTLLGEIDTMFNIHCVAFEQEGFKSIKPLYEANFPYIGKEVKISADFGVLNGKIEGLTDEGLLILAAKGARRLISIGDMD